MEWITDRKPRETIPVLVSILADVGDELIPLTARGVWDAGHWRITTLGAGRPLPTKMVTVEGWQPIPPPMTGEGWAQP